MKKKIFLSGLVIIAGMMIFTSCEKETRDDKLSKLTTVSEYLASKNEFSIFSKALEESNLNQVMDDAKMLMLFAPNDDAFNELFKQLGIKDLSGIPYETLTGILLYHALKNNSDDYWPEGIYTSLNSVNDNFVNMIISIANNRIKINNNSSLTGSRINVKNGAVFPVDKVLIPPTVYELAVATGYCNYLIQAAEKADIDDLLKGNAPVTVFAPADFAFSILFSEMEVSDLNELSVEQITPILKYHLVNGNIVLSSSDNLILETMNGTINVNYYEDFMGYSGFSINSESLTTVDNLQAVNGVLHIIDMVLIPD